MKEIEIFTIHVEWVIFAMECHMQGKISGQGTKIGRGQGKLLVELSIKSS